MYEEKILRICSKLFENIVFNQLYSYFIANNLITKNQSLTPEQEQVERRRLKKIDALLSKLSRYIEQITIFISTVKRTTYHWYDLNSYWCH